ncbi:DUF1456 family protein [Geomonas sp. Red875]|uniref:DUF1456 family protein n=1 Tax=Geomesophilobacter sediminis TaxID=2798584 RepID=A0A8J7S8A3_9BACT|nr:DUF1456 family protein [Geomesophilobacter sediminis]
MDNNDVLRRLRYALDLNNPTVSEIFRLSGVELKGPEVIALLKKETEEGFVPCDLATLDAFLDGLIALKRGKREVGGGGKTTEKLGNNLILRKLRIALELREEDMLAVFKLAGFPVSRSELSALFRAKGQSNYKACGDQILRNFIKGLTLRKGNG